VKIKKMEDLMNKFKAAFEILYFLSAIDGKVSDTEIDIIIDFLKANQSKIDFDPKKVIKSINLLNFDGIVNEFTKSTINFKETSSPQDRITLLDFAFDLIAADGKITDDEAKLFLIIGNTWDINMKKYLNRN